MATTTTNSFAPAALALMAGGALSDVFGSYYDAKSQKSGLKFESAVLLQNARIADMAARGEVEKGIREQQAIRLRAAKIKSQQRVAFAANGIAMDEGSALDLLTETDYFAEADANMAAYNAAQAAWGYKTQATQMRTTSSMKRTTAKGIRPGSAAAKSLIGGATNVALTWYQLDSLGPFDKE
jgi:hypothetical protein